MTHESECPIGNNNAPLTFSAARQNVAIICYCSMCSGIRAAYQRGREDATEELVAALNRKYPDTVFTITTEDIAAARRDGEQP